MTLQEAILRADRMRPNTVPHIEKVAWVNHLEADIYELMAVNTAGYDASWRTCSCCDGCSSCDNAAECIGLMMPAPYDVIYPLYLAAMIDNYQEEVQLYQNDMEIANAAIADAKAWWRRTHRQNSSKYYFRGL